MKTVHVVILTAFAAALAATVPAKSQEPVARGGRMALDAPSGGMLGTMPHGNYQCANPGDAGGDAYAVVAAENFRISTASRYQNDAGSGTYILRGRDLTFTSGPKRGENFRRVGDNQLRKLETDGTETKLLCTRLGSN